MKDRLKRLGYIVGGLIVAGLIAYAAAMVFPDATIVVTGLAIIFLLVMLVRPPKLVPVLQSRMMVLALLVIFSIGAVQSKNTLDEEQTALRAEQAAQKAEQNQQLSLLQAVNPNAYLNELKALGRDDEWFAALKEIHPEEYVVEKARRDKQARLEKARRDEEARQQLALKEEQDREQRIKQIFENAKGDGRHGIKLNAVDFKDIWNLSAPEGRLHCEQGPVYNGKPRPVILFDAGGVSYGVNGPAIGKGKYKNIHTITTQDATQTSTALITDHLISAGALMCRATLEEDCGSKYVAIVAAEKFVGRRLKAPKTAEYASSEAQAAMTGCGAWQVQSYVDAQNGFGALIRTHFTALVIKGSGEEWKLDDLKTSQ